MEQEEEKINTFQTPGEYVLRTGPALDPKYTAPKSINISGTLPAPFDFLLGKQVEDPQCHLLISKDIGKLELRIQDTDPYTTHTIVGTLKKDSVLEMFKLNTDTRWSVQSFIKFIRPLGYCFNDKAQLNKMIESLKKWNAKIETIIKEHQSNDGNSLIALEKKVSGVDVETKFKLTIPIFQGYQKETFGVEIGFDPKSTAVDLYLFSDEIFELEATKRESIMENELKKFDEYGFSKVVLS